MLKFSFNYPKKKFYKFQFELYNICILRMSSSFQNSLHINMNMNAFQLLECLRYLH